MSDYTHNIERKENARVSLTITVSKEKVKSLYTSTLSEITKKAQIKGFRKGKVPTTILEQKYGTAIKAETTEKIISEALKHEIEHVDLKPLYYSTPSFEGKAEDLMLDIKAPFTFTVSYDTTPTIEITDLGAFSLEEPTISITDEDIENELKGIQERNAISTDKTGKSVVGDVVTFSYVELDDDNKPIEHTKREDYTATAGKEQTIYDLNDEIIGLEANERKVITKTYPEDFKQQELAGKTVVLEIIVSRVRQKDIPPIDDELAQDVNEKYKTLDGLRVDIKKQLEKRAAILLDNQRREKILGYFVEHSTIDIPKDMVNVQLESSWNEFVRQYGGNETTILDNLKQAGKSKTEFLDTWRDGAKKQVAEQLIIGKLIDTEKITVTDDDVDAMIKEDCETSGNNYEEAKQYYVQNKLLPQIKHDLHVKRLFEMLQNKPTLVKGESLSFTQMLHEKNKRNNIDEQ